jgi:hypothetical protein
MSENRAYEGILDTSTVILLPRIASPESLPEVPLITSITLAELSVGPLVATNEQERAARLSHLQQAESDFEPLVFDDAAARAFGRVASSLRELGRKPKARAYDALIAATAISRNLPLFTCNPRDFEGIAELTVVAVPHPDHRRSLSPTQT